MSGGPANTSTTLGWSGALDGLRATAVLLVVFFHYGRDAWVPGGFLGVDIFFVLSGFLITTLLLQEWERHRTISLRRFYSRRALRLVPAFSSFVLVYMALVVAFPHTWLFAGQDFGDAARHAIYAITYLHNWVMASGERPPHSFGHIWTLAVEMQFYLVWPVALILMLRARLPRAMILGATCAGAVLSSISFLFLGRPSWELTYYGTQFRAHELLIGAIAAQLFAWQIVGSTTIRAPAFRALLPVSVVFIAALALTANEPAPLMFRGGYQLTAIAGAVIVLHCVLSPASLFARALAWRPLAYVGRRSYAIYLWHLPVGYSLRQLDPVPEAIIAAVLTLMIAELSYRLIERPALRLKDGLTPQVVSRDETAPESMPAAA